MSYNTRRQTGQGMGGVGRGAQVLYHQQQRSGPARMQQSGPNTPQHGYTSHSQQPLQNVQSGYGSQQSSPGYTTQAQSGGGSQGYSSQQYQSQTPHQQQQQQQQQPPPPQPPQPQQQPPPLPQAPQPPTPILKQTQAAPILKQTPAAPILKQTQSPQQPPAPLVKTEPVTPKPAGMEVDSDNAVESGGETGKVKSWQLKKKMPGFKINKKVKKRRQNARLRKLLQPKNAIMVLNELKTGIKFTFQEHTNALTQTMFVVNAEVDGKVHTGQGLSKPLAKQNAAENALKALLLEKMAQAAMKADTSDGSEPMQEDTNNDIGADSNNVTPEVSDETSESGKPETPEDDVPWGSLASFALYKLFTDWQSQGTHVPIPKQSNIPASKQIQTAPAPMKKIPDNPTDRHPVMLLNQMRPGIQFTEVSREGTPPNLTFTLGVIVDGKTYTGVAKNKKDAKKEAAKAALAGSLSIVYD